MARQAELRLLRKIPWGEKSNDSRAAESIRVVNDRPFGPLRSVPVFPKERRLRGVRHIEDFLAVRRITYAQIDAHRTVGKVLGCDKAQVEICSLLRRRFVRPERTGVRTYIGKREIVVSQHFPWRGISPQEVVQLQ